MDESTKEIIIDRIKSGEGYKKIARELNISLAKIKRFCRDNECESRQAKEYKASRTNSIDVRQAFYYFGGVCYLCGRRCDFNDFKIINGAFVVGETYPTLEHIVPIALGGKNIWNNINLACKKCNTRKNKKIIMDIPPVL